MAKEVHNHIDRRHFLSIAALAGGILSARKVLGADHLYHLLLTENDERYQIGVCDWMILKRQKLGAFPLAKTIGVDGVEVDMGGLGNRQTFDNKLSDPNIRKQFMDAAAAQGLKICSLAMSAFYAQSFAKRAGVEKMVGDCIGCMQEMDVKVAFLPLGVQCDLVKYPGLRPQLVKRLREAGKMAEKAEVIIGIESALDAKGELSLLQEIGSPAIQSYFNFENPLQNGRNLYEELEILGKEHICQIHCTDKDGVWLQNDPLIDMQKVKATLDKMNWKGWLVMERSRDANDPHNVKRNYGANARYLKKVFQH